MGQTFAPAITRAPAHGARAPAATSSARSLGSLQRKYAGEADTDAHATASVPPIVHDVLRSSGQPLDAATRAFMEPRFGHDFSQVRVHANERAAQAASSIDARAFTSNGRIVFGAGQYAPRSGSGRHLLSHELAHVLQQHAGVASAGGVGAAEDRHERHADAVADRVSAGGSAQALLADLAAPQASRVGTAGSAPIQRQPAPAPAWTKEEIAQIQIELIRLGLYTLTADGKFGSGTETGLVEAFGGEEWRKDAAATVLARLKAAKPPPGGKAGEHDFRYGEMFKDGLLEMTLGIGFDEDSIAAADDPRRNPVIARDKFVAEMTRQKFSEDKTLVAKVYKTAGRTFDESAFGRFFAREGALDYTPPAGPTRKVNAVVRLVYSLDGSEGKQVATAFKEGMVGSDVAYYSGHGRYGSGLDFDRNFKFSLLAADGSTVEQKVDDYEVLEKILEAEGKPLGRGAWAQFLWRVNNKRIDVISSNEGNVVVSPEAKHQGEFGGKLMYWNLAQTGGKGATSVAGKTGELATKAAAAPERKYRILVFDGCRSVDYEKSIRATPGFDAKSADTLASSRTLEWGDEGPTLAQFLTGIIAMQSAEEIVKNMDAQQHVGVGAARHVQTGAYGAYGIQDNPLNK
jgi:uncharacterized protein DUF4157